MLPPETCSFSYAYTGGSPPATREALLVYEDGTAQYITGHSWPRQPPFDEIGIYQRLLSGVELTQMRELRDMADRHLDKIGEPRADADAGLESVTVSSKSGDQQAYWSASVPPEIFKPLLEKVRDLIADLRQHPLSTLHSTLEISAADPAHIYFRLQNRGTLPFTLYRSEEQTLQARILFRTEEELRASSSTSRSPVQLLRLEPSRLSEKTQTPQGESQIGPGESLLLTLRDSPLQRRPERPVTLYALLRVFWKIAGLEIQTPVQEGWLMPQPVEAQPAFGGGLRVKERAREI